MVITTNPIRLVKTRLQLDRLRATDAGGEYKSSLDCVSKVIRRERIKGLYRGLSAGCLGVLETTLHLVIYEQMKIGFARGE
jgi:solute carrier family 25, member 33/36